MDPADKAAADGSIGIDHAWKATLAKLLAETPLAASLWEAAQPLPHVDMDLLRAVIDGKREDWEDELRGDEFNLPASYRLDFAVAIHVYTLANPPLYRVVNEAMFNPSRRKPGAAGTTISDELRACLPYIKFLDAALDALPPAYVYTGEVRRGVPWVWPSPDAHEPAQHFRAGQKVMWYEFKSTSKRMEVMTRPHFCGVNAGPRTIFTVQACCAYSIEKFSYFQGVDSEYEVLFRPLSRFQVVHAQKNIIDPKETTSLERSGFPDAVILKQLPTNAPTSGPPTPIDVTDATPGPSDALPSEADQLAWAMEQSKLLAQKEVSIPLVSSAEVDAFMTKVGSSLDEVKMATELEWDGQSITDANCKVMAHLIASGALDHLTVRWRPAALFPCLETWQVRSPD
jgi:hypothetical protein